MKERAGKRQGTSEVLMNERDDMGTGGPAVSSASPRGTPPGAGQDKWSAAEQAGPAVWSDRVPGSAAGAGEAALGGGAAEPGRQGMAHKTAEKASRLAQEAGQGVEQAVSRRKDEAAERIAGIASAVREAARSLQQQGPDGLSRYAESAAQQLERASGYLRERDLRGMLREVEGAARRRPELFLAGSVLVGLALARFLKSSSRRPHASGEYESPYYAEGSYAGESSYLQEGSYERGYEPVSSPPRGMGEI
jgi:hypothetical protein